MSTYSLTAASPIVYTTVDNDGDTKMTLMQLGKLNDEQARQYIEGLLWPNGPVCPHCKSTDCTRLNGKAHRPGTVQCNACRGQFTVTVGTVMERSKISLSRWLMAFHLMCSSKKGFSALQLQRNLGLGSYKTAWFMFHRIRHAMESGPMAKALAGAGRSRRKLRRWKPRVTRQSKRGTRNEQNTGRSSGRAGRVGPVEACRIRGTATPCTVKLCGTSIQNRLIITDEMPSYTGSASTSSLVIRPSIIRPRNTLARTVRLFDQLNTAESFFALD